MVRRITADRARRRSRRAHAPAFGEERREQTLEEIDSDLARIEAQVDLILENATMSTKPQTISTDIELASDLLGAGVFGADESAISELDRKFSSQKSRMRETS